MSSIRVREVLVGIVSTGVPGLALALLIVLGGVLAGAGRRRLTAGRAGADRVWGVGLVLLSVALSGYCALLLVAVVASFISGVILRQG